MIVEAKEKDAKLIAKMAREVWDNDSIDELEKEFIQIARDKNSTCFIKIIDKKVIGFSNVSLRHYYVEGTETSPVAYLEGIFVDEKYRKRGYGKELLLACENWARKMDCKEFASDSLLDNIDSYNFHLASGFVEANRIICYKKDL